jgi:hypothetical protein
MWRNLYGLHTGGAQVEVIIPDTHSVQAFGLNLINQAQSGHTARAGMRQGHAAPSAFSAIWQ